jgi:transcriptional regulator with XRE-family HTH domain
MIDFYKTEMRCCREKNHRDCDGPGAAFQTIPVGSYLRVGHTGAPQARSRRGRSRMTSAVAKIIDDLRDRGGLKGTDVANIAAVSPATVSRWTAGKALPHPKTQLLISDLRYIVDRLSEFYSPEETRLWLYSKHRLLDGERAIDLINKGHADKVLAVIESLDEGTFT